MLISTVLLDVLFGNKRQVAAQHCFAADAVGAAPDLGAMIRQCRAIARAGLWMSPTAPLSDEQVRERDNDNGFSLT